jgi:hypothetical protein
LDPSVIDMDPNDPAPEGGDEAGAQGDGGEAQASGSDRASEDEYSD